MLASFSLGLCKGLKTQTEPVKYVYEYLQALSAPHIAIAFNVIGFNIWDELIKFGTKNIMWTVDSPFHQNISVYEKYKDSQGVASFAVSPSDIEAMKLFFPNIPYFYIPHGTDPDIWQPDDSGEEKEHDIVFLGSIRDYEQNLADLKEKLDKNIYKLLMNISISPCKIPTSPSGRYTTWRQTSMGLTGTICSYMFSCFRTYATT